MKWFPPARKGLITGIVVAGFGLASVYIAPLTKWLLHAYGVPGAFRILGIAFLVVTVGLAQLLVNPPSGYVAVGSVPGRHGRRGAARAATTTGARWFARRSSRCCGSCSRARRSRAS